MAKMAGCFVKVHVGRDRPTLNDFGVSAQQAPSIELSLSVCGTGELQCALGTKPLLLKLSKGCRVSSVCFAALDFDFSFLGVPFRIPKKVAGPIPVLLDVASDHRLGDVHEQPAEAGFIEGKVGEERGKKVHGHRQ